MAPPEVLVFTDESSDEDRHPVLDAHGQVVASIERLEPGRSFTARTPEGELLCTGTPRRLRRDYLVRDTTRRTLVVFRNPAVTVRRSLARLADGSQLTLRVKLRTGTWTIEDARRRDLITIERPRERGRPYAATAHILDRELPLAMVISLVAGHLHHQAGDTIWDYFGNNRP